MKQKNRTSKPVLRTPVLLTDLYRVETWNEIHRYFKALDRFDAQGKKAKLLAR